MYLLVITGGVIAFMALVILCTPNAKDNSPSDWRVVSLGKRLDTGKPLAFKFDLGTHLLFAGLTGFGKSNEINYLISQLAMYDDVQFLIANAKNGTDFMCWLPRASSLAIGPEASDTLVDEALRILYERYEQLIPEADPNTLDGMSVLMQTERKVNIHPNYPLLVIIVDEFIEYLKGKNATARAHKLHTLATTGRAVGVVLVIASQRPSQWSAPTDIRENIPYHVSFRLDQYGTDMIFGKGAMAELDLHSLETIGHGYAVVPGELEPVQFIAPECPEEYCRQIAWQTHTYRKAFNTAKLIQDAA